MMVRIPLIKVEELRTVIEQVLQKKNPITGITVFGWENGFLQSGYKVWAGFLI
jgi:hypothetical protein